jgi:ubiquinone biosynthesis protein UbiJ
MKFPDPADAPSHLANRILEQESWAREKLAVYTGRVFTLSVGPLRTAFRVSENGTLEGAPASVTADLALRVSPLNVPALLAQPQRWNEFVREEGDANLGGELKALAQALPWFVEQAFAKTLGPLVGQRVADAGRALLAFPEYAGQRVADSVASYARDEAGLLASAGEMRDFASRVATITERAEALARRIDMLAGSAQNAKP